jgi:ABC-type lipoprotein release transport system permease subunit
MRGPSWITLVVMIAIGMLVRSILRRQLAGFVLLAVIGGLGMGFSMVAMAGARRADSAYDRLRLATRSPDAMFDGTGVDDATLGRLAEVPEVRAIARFSYTPVSPASLAPGVDSGAFVGFDDDFLTRVYRPLVLSGRLPRPDAADEVLVNESLAKVGHLRAGQRVTLVSGFDKPASIGDATIVGVVRGIFDVGANTQNLSMLLSKAFLDQHRDQLQIGPQPGVLVRLADGESGIAGFERAARAVTGRDVAAQFSGNDEAEPTARVLAVQTIGLALLGLVAFVATIAVTLQALSRLLDDALADLPILVAIGLRPRQRLTVGALLAVPVALVGCLVASGVATFASPLVPTGFARAVDPVRGIRVDLTVVVAMAIVWVLAIGGIGVALAWRHGRGSTRRRSRGRTGRLVGSLPARARLGCEAALVPVRGPGGAASRSALVAVAFAVTCVIALGTFGVSLRHLLDDPALQGWDFDAAIVSGDGSVDSLQQSLSGLSSDGNVEGIGWMSIVDVEIEGRPVEAYAFEPGGAIHPTMRFGHPPLADDEVVLGADIMARRGLSIGDTVEVAGQSDSTRLVVVGSATYPELGNNSDLAGGASLTMATASRLGVVVHGGAALIRLGPGARTGSLAKYSGAGEFVMPFRPPRVRNLEQVGALPWVLATFVALLGLFAVGHGMWRSVRARRRDLAVLATVGFRPRDLRAIVLWQATCIAVVGIGFGVIAGIILGKAAWTAVAGFTGVVDQLVVPVLGIVVVTVVVLGLHGLIGLMAARWAVNSSPAVGLRSE